MPRSMWRGAVSFGMVAIPVRMYLATESKSVSFRMLCPTCLRPIRQKRWCEHENKEVGWTEVVRGYEVAKDEFVPVGDEDLDRLPLPSAKTIEISEFVEDSDIEAGLYLKTAYYLEPEAVGKKPYRLLREALERTGRVAIAKIALRDREHLCRLTVHGRGLLLNTLHWPDEIRPVADLDLPDETVDLHKRELDMALMLVENLTATFDPERYRDGYREALLAVVEEKLGKREAVAPVEAEPPQVGDLMAALKASVEAAQSRRVQAPAPAEVEAVGRGGQAAAARRTSAGNGRTPKKAEPARRRKAS